MTWTNQKIVLEGQSCSGGYKYNQWMESYINISHHRILYLWPCTTNHSWSLPLVKLGFLHGQFVSLPLKWYIVSICIIFRSGFQACWILEIFNSKKNPTFTNIWSCNSKSLCQLYKHFAVHGYIWSMANIIYWLAPEWTSWNLWHI